MIPDLDEKAANIVEVGDHLTEIDRLMTEYSIIDAASLTDDKRALSQLCYAALKLYDAAEGSKLIRNTHIISDRRANLAHHTSTLNRKGELAGFDKISPEEIWRDHLSNGGCVNMIRREVQETLSKRQDVKAAVHEISMRDKSIPFNLPNKADFSHLPVIRSSSKAIENGMKYVPGLLFFLTTHQTPPTTGQLIRFVSELLKVREEQIQYSVSELVHNEIVKQSNSGNFLLIINEQFAANSANDFLDAFDLDAVIEQYEVLINE